MSVRQSRRGDACGRGGSRAVSDDRLVHIVDYQERWPREFADIGAQVRNALGDLAIRIDHIGSTAVPDLAAKDIIDVQVSVAAFAGFGPVAAALEGLGYVRRDDVRHDHLPPGAPHAASEYEKRYFREPEDARRTHIHVRADGRVNQRYAILFRDYLREHRAAALAYEETKRFMARWHNEQDKGALFYEIKAPVADIVTSAAEEWAARVAWQPGTSDA
ncbi:hypothetical protein CMK11_13845 [Candidatus Poribacteria bacterium]|nr:hypothetical protein [Candidatus Poribacteria bacterium]